MKKLLSACIVSILFFTSTFSISANETTMPPAQSYSYVEEVYADGSYWAITIEEISSSSLTRATQTKQASKTNKYVDANGKVLWSVTVTGTFTYNGSSATCTKSAVSTLDASVNWTVTNEKAWKLGATAYASAQGNEIYVAGIVFRTINKQVALTCSPTGKLS